MSQRKDKRWQVLPPDTFEGKTVTLADTDVVETYPQIAASFMSEIFELDPGEYLITDEADLLDFTPFDDSENTSEIWNRIESTYGISQADVGSGLLIRIFEAIAKRRWKQ